jgi:hypothetical protein
MHPLTQANLARANADDINRRARAAELPRSSTVARTRRRFRVRRRVSGRG